MLGKLLKHETIAVSRLLLPLHGLLILMSLLGRMLNNFQIFERIPSVFQGLMVLAYFLVFAAVPTATLIFLIVRFYKNLYTDEGYLMFTLPVKPWQLQLSKGLVFTLWTILDIIFVFGSLAILFVDKRVMDIFHKLSPVLTKSFEAETNASFSSFIFWLIILFVVAAFTQSYTYYTAISIGQMSSNHKVLYSFVAYFGIYMILQIVSTIIIFAATIPTIANPDSAMQSFMSVFGASAFLSIAIGVICFFINNYIMKKKLNLS